jgi:hypothetical protein
MIKRRFFFSERLPGRSPLEVIRKKENGVDHVVRSLAAGGAQDDKNVSSQRIVSADTLHVVES